MSCEGTWSQITKKGHNFLGHQGKLLSGFGPRLGQLADGNICQRLAELDRVLNSRVKTEPQTTRSALRAIWPQDKTLQEGGAWLLLMPP